MDRTETTTNVEQSQQKMIEINRWLDAEIAQIEADSQKTTQEKTQTKAELTKNLITDLIESNVARKMVEDSIARGENVPKEEIRKVITDSHDNFVTVVLAAKKGLDVGKDSRSQALLLELSRTIPDPIQAAEIMDKIGPWITGNKQIVFSRQGEVKSEFENKIDEIKAEDPQSAKLIVNSIARRAYSYGLSEEAIGDKFGIESNNISPEVEQFYRASGADPEDADLDSSWASARELYASKFSVKQMEFLKIFYSPERFKKYAVAQTKLIGNDRSETEHIRKNIINVYTDINKRSPPADKLEQLVQEKITQEVSEGIGQKLNEITQQLYIRTQRERPHKYHQEIEQEDFLRGIVPIREAIKSALQKINMDIGNLIKDGDKSFEGLHFAVRRQKANIVQERAKLDEEGRAIKMLPYLRSIPMPYYKTVGVNDFLLNLSINFDHGIHKSAYLHNVRAIFNRPAGKEGFYAGLGEYAEELSGTDLDEMMALSDGNLDYQAYVLYEKIVDEQFALQDWHHRPDQFTNKYEEISTELEQEIVDRLMLQHGKNYTIEQIIAAKNAAVGMSQGVFLTGPEKCSYADPTNAEGVGMVASYGTGDAGPLMVFNPLHYNLRWGGETLMNPILFMPLEGEKSFLRNHNVMFKSMNDFYDSFVTGNQKLPKRLFIDEIMDICNVGGPGKRRGWRLQYSLDGHFVYEEQTVTDLEGKDIENPTLNPLKTFKAMDVIGYEALADFMQNRMPEEILSAEDGSSNGKKKNELFEHIFNKYFKEFDKNAHYEDYMKKLRVEGEAAVIKNLKGSDETKKNVMLMNVGSLGEKRSTSFKEQIELQTSKIFIQRFLAREIAARMPTKFMRIDKNRLNPDGVSKWTHIYETMKKTNPGLTREGFDHIMKDLDFAEMLLRNRISRAVKERLEINNELRLDEVADCDEVNSVLNEEMIRKLFKEEINSEGGMPAERVENVIKAYRLIRSEFYDASGDAGRKYQNFLDNEAIQMREDYTFTFGLEDTDFTLMSFRSAGPRTIPRAIKDVADAEKNIIPEITQIGNILKSMAADGNGDFKPIIDYLIKAQKSLVDIHNTPVDYKFTYQIATLVINYFQRDSLSKPLFGLFTTGKLTSIASEYAGRNSAVVQWDSRQISNFITALESARLIPKNPYDLNKKPRYTDIWVINPFTGKPMNTHFKKRIVDWEFNGTKLRKEHGGSTKAVIFDYLDQWIPITLLALLAKYIWDAIQEMTGKKK